MKIENEQDLLKLITDQIEESLHIDYKAADALAKTDGKKKEISKDVSALANSDGGIIIYGVREFSEASKKHLPELIDPIDRTTISKEWIEQVINGNISPRISNIKINPIPLNSSINKVAYVVEVPKSQTAHQAADYRYYKRFNFESVPMHDYEVRDIMNRSKHPVMMLEFELETYVTADAPYSLPGLQKKNSFGTLINKLNVYGRNTGGVYTNYVNCYIEIPSSLLDIRENSHLDEYEKNGINYKSIYCDNTIREIREASPGFAGEALHKYWPSRYEPILPGTRMSFNSISLASNKLPKNLAIYWKIYADNAECQQGEISIEEIDTTDTF